MQITLSVNGRFHSFDVARELARRGQLRRLITSYPFFVARRWEIPRARAVCLPGIELTKRVVNRWSPWPAELLCAPYDAMAARLLPEDSDLVESWSGSSLLTIRRARALGVTSVVKRSSAHIVVQSELLQEEHARWGVKGNAVPPFIIERELREYEEADYILTSSAFIARTFRERGVDRRKILCLPLAVDTSAFHPGSTPHRGFRLLFCGAASLQKGIPYLLQAFAALRLPDAELWLVGGIGDDVRPLLERFGGPWLRCLGPVPHQQLAEVYRACDALCLPSIQDGFGTVVTQAMACGLPVIVSENVGAADALDPSTGMVVPVRDVDALGRAIVALYDDPERRRAMGRRAAERVRGAGSWSAYVEALLGLYGSFRRAGPCDLAGGTTH